MPQHSCSVDEHENRRAGLRAQRGVMCREECDEALERGGLSAASEGVDDMDRGIGFAHRGQDAPVVLVYDSQRWRQVVQEAIVSMGRKALRHLWSLGAWPATAKAARAGPRSDASALLSAMHVAMAGPA